MGAALARLEARVALTEALARIRAYDVDEAGLQRVHSINVRGLAALPTTVDAALMPRFDPQPDRRPAVVTGASSGIGAETARVLARAGHPVVLGARRAEVCEEIAEEIRAEGGEAAAFELDLADPGTLGPFVERAEAAFGPVEILVSNAARIQPGSALETTPEDFEAVLRVNAGGAHRLVRAFGAGMVARRRGDLIFVTSDVVGAPAPAHGGLRGVEVGARGVRDGAADGAGGDRACAP